MHDYEPSNEGRLWHAVLITFYIDAAARNLSETGWLQLRLQAKSEWIKNVCNLISLDHDFFIENLTKVRKNRRLIKFINTGLVEFDDEALEKLQRRCLHRGYGRTRKSRRDRKSP